MTHSPGGQGEARSQADLLRALEDGTFGQGLPLR